MDLYQQTVMDHYRNPRNRGAIACPDFISDLHNPSCGDSIAIQGTISLGRLAEVAFYGSGCVISQAAASLLTTTCKGKQINEIKAVDKNTMLELLGIELGPTRLKCALLALDALHQGINNYQQNQTP